MDEKVTSLIFKELKTLARKIDEFEDSDVINFLRKEIKEIKELNSQLRNKLMTKEEEWREQEKEWLSEKEIMKTELESLRSKQKELEIVENKRDRRERRKNIIITGARHDDKLNSDVSEIAQITLKHVTGEDIKTEEVYLIKGNNMKQDRIVVTLASL